VLPFPKRSRLEGKLAVALQQLRRAGLAAFHRILEQLGAILAFAGEHNRRKALR
jgi:hypothetical protein